MSWLEHHAPVVMITGAGRGLGREMALAFAREGYAVAVTGIEGVRDTTSAIQESGGTALGRFLDVTRPHQADEAVTAVFETWGRIDVLVNNAGVSGPTAPLGEVSSADWERTLSVNLSGAFYCDRAVVSHMVGRRQGCIVHMASVGGLTAYPLRAPYAAAKRGLIALTETLAVELGPYDIRVNAVCPGPVEGKRMCSVVAERAVVEGCSQEEVEAAFRARAALGRMVTAGDVVGLVLFLASEAGKNITGQAIRVCAGYAL